MPDKLPQIESVQVGTEEVKQEVPVPDTTSVSPQGLILTRRKTKLIRSAVVSDFSQITNTYKMTTDTGRFRES